MLYDGKPSVTGQANLTVLGAGTLFKGEVEVGTGDLRAEGTVEGTIASEGTVTVSPTGLVSGTILARCLVVTGRVQGTFRVTRCLEIHSGGWVEGEVRTGALVVDEGSTLQGWCGRLEAPPGATPATLPTSPQPAWSGTRPGPAVGDGTGRPALGAILGVLVGIALLLVWSFAYLRHRQAADPASVQTEPAPVLVAPVSSAVPPQATTSLSPVPTRKPALGSTTAPAVLKPVGEPVGAPPALPRPEPASAAPTNAAPQEAHPQEVPTPTPAPAQEEQPEAPKP